MWLLSEKTRFKFHDKPLDFSREMDQEAEAIWSEAIRREKRNLTDNLVYAVTERTVEAIEFTPVYYRYVFAQIQKPDLHESLRLYPAAVAGLLLHRNDFLFGKRGLEVSQYSGWWESVPSGSIDVPSTQENLFREVQREFEEETELEPTLIPAGKPLLLTRDPVTHTTVICFGAKILDNFERSRLKPSVDYSEFCWVSRAKLSETEKLAGKLIPSTNETISAILSGKISI